MVSSRHKEVAMETNFNTLSEVERVIELGDTKLDIVSGNRGFVPPW